MRSKSHQRVFPAQFEVHKLKTPHMINDLLLFIIHFSLFAGSSLAKSNMYSGPHT